MRILLVLLISYGVICLAAYLGQSRLLYFPGGTDRTAIERQAARFGLRPWPASGPELRGLLGNAGPSGNRGTILVFHGNAGSAGDRAYYALALERRGFRVILAEYPGYGGRPGSTNERSLVEDGMETFRRALQEFGPPVYLWGESLGCGVVTGIARRVGSDARGLVLLTPWSDLPALAQHVYPWLPARWLVRDRFDNVANLRDYADPVAVVIAGRDEVIPGRLSHDLYASIRGTKRRWTFEGAGHNSWDADPSLGWWNEVAAFLEGERAGNAGTAEVP